MSASNRSFGFGCSDNATIFQIMSKTWSDLKKLKRCNFPQLGDRLDIFITRSYNCKSEGVVSSHYILLWLGCQNASSSDSFFIEIFCLRQPVSALPCAATCLAHVHAVAFEMLTTNRSKIRLLATSLKNRIPDYISCLKYLAAKIRRVLHSIRMTHLYSQLSCEPTIYTSTRQICI